MKHSYLLMSLLVLNGSCTMLKTNDQEPTNLAKALYEINTSYEQAQEKVQKQAEELFKKVITALKDVTVVKPEITDPEKLGEAILKKISDINDLIPWTEIHKKGALHESIRNNKVMLNEITTAVEEQLKKISQLFYANKISFIREEATSRLKSLLQDVFGRVYTPSPSDQIEEIIKHMEIFTDKIASVTDPKVAEKLVDTVNIPDHKLTGYILRIMCARLDIPEGTAVADNLKEQVSKTYNKLKTTLEEKVANKVVDERDKNDVLSLYQHLNDKLGTKLNF